MRKICTNTISKSQQAFLEQLADITIAASLDSPYSISYRMLSDICKKQFDIDFYDAFGITSFSKLPSCLFDEAVMFIADWFPDDDTMELSIFVEDEFQQFIYRYVDNIPKESPAYQQMMEDFMYAVCSGAKGLD